MKKVLILLYNNVLFLSKRVCPVIESLHSRILTVYIYLFINKKGEIYRLSEIYCLRYTYVS